MEMGLWNQGKNVIVGWPMTAQTLAAMQTHAVWPAMQSVGLDSAVISRHVKLNMQEQIAGQLSMNVICQSFAQENLSFVRLTFTRQVS